MFNTVSNLLQYTRPLINQQGFLFICYGAFGILDSLNNADTLDRDLIRSDKPKTLVSDKVF